MIWKLKTDSNAIIHPVMKLLYSAYIKNPKHIEFEGEDPDEQVLLTLRRHPITNLRWILITAFLLNVPKLASFLLNLNGVSSWDFMPGSLRFVLIVFWFLFTFSYFFTSFLIWFYSVYIVSSKRVVDIDFHGFLHRRFSEALLSNIEDLTHQYSGFGQVTFNYATLHIQTAGEMRELEFECIPRPGEVQDFVSDLAAESHRKLGHRRRIDDD